MPKVTLEPSRQSARDIDIALRKFKKKVEAAGTLKTLQEKSFFERPGQKRNRKRAAAVMRHRRKAAEGQLPKKLF